MSSTEITYSAGMPLILTSLCSNKCGYCDFAAVKKNHLPSKKVIISKINKAAGQGASAIHIVSGEEIGENPSILSNIKYYGFSSYMDYVKMTVESVLSSDNPNQLLPILDVGIFSITDFVFCRDWIFAYRLALESSDSLLMSEIPHRESPAKKPEVRKFGLVSAGKAKIPTTTAILLGIGEKVISRFKTLEAIIEINEKYNHIQAVEINRFTPKRGTPMASRKPMSDRVYLNFIKDARKILPESIKIQIDINSEEDLLPALLENGVDDIGMIDISRNHGVSVEQIIERLNNKIKSTKVKFRERMPVYDNFILKGWFPERFLRNVKAFYNDRIKDHAFAEKIKKCIISDPKSLKK